MLGLALKRRARRRLGYTGTRAAAIGVIAGFALRIWATATEEFGLAFLSILTVVVFAVLLLLWPAVSLSGYAVRRRDRAAPRALRQAGGVAGVLFLVLGGILFNAGLRFHLVAAVPALACVTFGAWVIWNAFRLTTAPASDGAGPWRHWGPPVAAAAVLLLLVMHAAVAQERRAVSRELGYRAAMRSDLRNLVTLQENLRRETGTYTSDLANRLTPSPGTVGPEIHLTRGGWRATLRHEGTAVTCTVFVGTTPHGPATVSGEPACTDLEIGRLDDGPVDVTFFLLGMAFGALALLAAGRTTAPESA